MKRTFQSKGAVIIALLSLIPLFGMFSTSCSNDDEPIIQHDVVLNFADYPDRTYIDEIDDMDAICKLAEDPSVANIYMHVMDGNNWAGYGQGSFTSMKYYMDKRFRISPKIHGSGTFNIHTGSILPADSLWFVSKGWKFNSLKLR